MKKLLFALLLAPAALLCADPGEEAAMAEKATRLKGFVADLDSERQNVREEAATALLAAGADAIPYVLDGIYRKNARLHLQVLEKLVEQEKAVLPAEMRLSDEDLKAIVQERLGDPKTAQQGRTYLYAKYIEAVELEKKGRFDDALAKLNAIKTLEPHADFISAVKELERKCQDQHVQAWLVRLSATTSTPVCQDNGTAKVTFTATNMSAGDVEIWFGEPAEADNPDVRKAVLGQESLEIKVTTMTCGADGGNFSEEKPTTRSIATYSIPIKKGADARIAEIEIPTLANGRELVKIFVSARLRVFRVDGPTPLVSQHLLESQAAEIRVLPVGDLQAAMKNPLQDLMVSIDHSDWNSVFLFSNIMPEMEKPKAVQALIGILRDAKFRDGEKAVARNCLATLTGKSFAKSDEWLKWFADLPPANIPPEK
ncbi:MAG: hypothetical protein K8T20_18935 [Planctomycetes bacterium]|nr:hypothetical protein [Planctomycetota bacterium]